MPENNENIDLNENTEVRRQKKILEEAIKNPGNEFPELADEHEKMVRALKSLVEETDRMYTKDQDGRYPKLDRDAQKKMVDLYRNAIDATENYRSGVQETIYRKKRDKRAVGEPIAKLMETVTNVMSGDFKVLLSATKHGIKTLPNVIRYARTNIVDLGNQNTSTIGANQSSRLRMKVPSENGQMAEGYFTPNNGALPEQREALMKAREKFMAKANGMITEDQLAMIGAGMASHFRRYKYDHTHAMNDFFDSVYTGLQGEDVHIAPDRVILECVNDASKTDEEFALMWDMKLKPEMFDGTGLSQMLADYFVEVNQIKLKYGILEDSVQADTTENMDQRNSAMSDMAKLLDMDHLIAHAESMTIKRGDKLISGTFMEGAKGDDLSVRNMGSTFADPNVKISVENPQLKENLADLQILDYICGNIDRHNANMLYQFDKTDPDHVVCTGIQGIDNDSSFGRIRDGRNRLPKVKELGVISEKTALMVNNLSPAITRTMLRNYKFSQAEVEAVIRRTSAIKEAVKTGSIKVVGKAEWEKLNPWKMRNTYFERVKKGLTSSKKNDLLVSLYEENNKNYKKNFMLVYNLRKPIRNLQTLLENADKKVWGGSEEFKNTREAFKKFTKAYNAGMQKPTEENIKKLQDSLENVLKNARAYKKLKSTKTNLNEKETRRLQAMDAILNAGETELTAIDMLHKSCVQKASLQEWEGKSFDQMMDRFLSTMRRNVNTYPEGSKERENGEKAMDSVKALAEMTRINLSADLKTQQNAGFHMAVIFRYDPELMKKTELTFAFGNAGADGRRKTQMRSAMDVVTFLNDVYTNEKIKAPTMEERVEREMQEKRNMQKKEQEKTSIKEGSSRKQMREDERSSAMFPRIK